MPLNTDVVIVAVEAGNESTGRPVKLFLFHGGAPQVLAGDPTTAAAVTPPAAAPSVVRL